MWERRIGGFLGEKEKGLFVCAGRGLFQVNGKDAPVDKRYPLLVRLRNLN